MVGRNLLVGCVAGWVLAASAVADDSKPATRLRNIDGAQSPITASAVADDSKPATAKKSPKAHAATEVHTASAPAAPPTPLSRQRRQRRQQWEQALQAPAELTVGDEKTITLGQLLEQIREKHKLNVQLDMPHLLPIAKAFESGGASSAGVTARAAASWMPFAIRPSSSVCEPGGPCPTYPPQYAPMAFSSSAPVCAAPACAAPASAVAPVAAAAPATGAYYPPAATPYLAAHVPAPAVAAPLPASAELIVSQAAIILNSDDIIVQVSASDGDEVAAEESAPKSKSEPQAEPAAPASKPAAEPEVESSVPKAKPDHEGDAAESADDPRQALSEALKSLLDAPVDASLVTQPDATVEDILRQAISNALPMQAMMNAAMADELSLPASLTRATEWDLLVQDNGVLITPRLNANLQKETRVYSIRALEKSSDLKAEDVARVLTRTVRPWSWRRYYPEATAETASAPNKKNTDAARKVSIPKVNLDLLSLLLSSNLPVHTQRIRLTSNDDDSTVTIGPSSGSEKVELTEQDLELISRAWTGMFDATVTSMQVLYHGDPPTGVVEVLPGMLIISQSQGAHREIADLLEQLSHPDN